MSKKIKSISNKNNNRKKQLQYANYLLFFLSFLLLTFIPWAAASFWNPIPDGVRLSLALLAAITGLVIQQYLNKEDITAAIESVKKETSIEYVGSSSEVLPRIAKKVRHAANVRNTFVGIDEYDYTKSNDDIVYEIYKTWLENDYDGKWVDIVGPAQLFSGRYEKISASKAKMSGSHEVKILRHSTPIVNFIILEYPNEESDVFFGWMTGSKDSKIFYSPDKHAVAVFKSYFRRLEKHRLWGEPIRIDYKSKKNKRLQRNDLVDKIGNWVTLSVKDGEIETYGFFTIGITRKPTSFSRSGIIFLNGLLVDSRMNYLNDIDHGREHISHYTNKMFIEYGAANKGRQGFCFYEFEQNVHNEEVEGSHVSGFYVNHGGTSISEILGFKTAVFEPLSEDFNRSDAAKYTLENLKLQKRISEEQFNIAIEKIKK